MRQTVGVSPTAASPNGSRPGPLDQPLDVSRAAAALRRSRWLIALIVIPVTATVLVLSLALPKTYSATASLVLEEPSDVLGSPDAASSARRLATMRRLLTSRDTLERAARRLPGETTDTLVDKVTVAVDDAANVIAVTAVDGDAQGAADIANEVPLTFLERRRSSDRRRQARARAALESALERAEREGGSSAEAQAIRERLSEMTVSQITEGDDLRIAESARPPESPESPRPLQNTILAFAAAIFLAVLAALARDLLSPRLAGPRQLEELTGLTPVAVMPSGRWRRRGAAQAAEAYHSLAASLRLRLPADCRTVVVTGAYADDERARVVVGLGQALAASGIPTLLVSADLRQPALHSQLGVPPAPGMGEVLNALEQDSDESAAELIRATTRADDRPSRGELRALPSGDTSQHPAALLSGDALAEVFLELGGSEYRYVIVEGPALLGPIDGQLVAREADALLVVCDLNRLSRDDAADLGAVVERLGVRVLGTVVVGDPHVSYSLGEPTTPVPAA